MLAKRSMKRDVFSIIFHNGTYPATCVLYVRTDNAHDAVCAKRKVVFKRTAHNSTNRWLGLEILKWGWNHFEYVPYTVRQWDWACNPTRNTNRANCCGGLCVYRWRVMGEESLHCNVYFQVVYFAHFPLLLSSPYRSLHSTQPLFKQTVHCYTGAVAGQVRRTKSLMRFTCLSHVCASYSRV